MKKETLCPCGSGKEYDVCCAPVIAGTVQAETAEMLMRARYSAYVKHEISFILNSCDRENRERDIDETATREWSEKSEWLGLKIMSTEKGKSTDTEGVVEFIATYNSENGMHENHHEIASFKKEDGAWVYTTGKLIQETVVRSVPKVGRNDLCPCGSGKKYKHCCGR